MIALERLRKSFGPLVAVDDLDCTIDAGTVFGFLGRNGAGKTTTIRMLYGFTPKSGGVLRVFGLDIDRELRAIKARIGVCQQENNLDPDLTVQQNLELFARYFDIPRRQAREKAEELLAFIALAHRRNDNVPTLSGGMMRRLVLARALINDPELLILDEPTTGLDPQARHQVWQRLDELKGRGLTILLTTHYMEEAARLCDRLVIMDHGRVLVEGRPHDLVQAHVGREVIEILAPAEPLREYVRQKGLEHEDLGHRLIIYSGESDALYHRLVDAYCREGCTLRQATLEDVFLRLTGRELRE
ncbi:MAG TPA: ABC transporter ATP-binding protein [Desulfuromonadales bacterium]|nr:ABC transporter ATP-binding protein [Desulfuromonadales bacterium]